MSISSNWSKYLKFLAVGIANTLLTWFLYILLLKILPYHISYTFSYVVGICIAYVSYRFFVFKRVAINNGLAWVSLIYIIQYFLGIFIVVSWTEKIGGMVELAPIVSLLITYPLVYIATNVIFKAD